MEESNTKTVFISYCWTTHEHQKWVIELAKKILSVGVDVKLDVWDLQPGNDTYAFMEQMVTNPNIDKVLMICEKGYKDKADSRNGGVGTETKIITPEIYSSVDQKKFIPIIIEAEENNFTKYVPTYARGILGIDMTSEERFGESFEELLRCIYEKPRYKKPAIGNNTPSFLEDNSVAISISLKLKNDEIKKYMDRNNYGLVIEKAIEFRNLIMIELEKFIITDINEGIDKCRIYIDDMKEIRDQYLIRTKYLISYLTKDDLEEILIEDLEKLYKFTEYQGINSYNDFTVGHFRFLIYEIFLWINMLLFNYKKYSIITTLLTNDYYVESKYSDNKKDMRAFYDRWGVLDNYKTEGSNRISLNADKLIERSILNSIDYKRNLVITDLIIYYANRINKESKGYWFPRLYIFHERYGHIKEFEKMNDNKYFDKIKCIFGVDTIEELKEKTSTMFPVGQIITGYNNTFDGIPNINHLINRI